MPSIEVPAGRLLKGLLGVMFSGELAVFFRRKDRGCGKIKSLAYSSGSGCINLLFLGLSSLSESISMTASFCCCCSFFLAGASRELARVGSGFSALYRMRRQSTHATAQPCRYFAIPLCADSGSWCAFGLQASDEYGRALSSVRIAYLSVSALWPSCS